MCWQKVQEQAKKIDLEYADGMLYDVINAIEELQEVYQIVFMPYKAAMWDAFGKHLFGGKG